MQPNLSQPYPIEATLPSAGILVRFAAMVYDTLIMLGIYFVLTLIVTGVNGMESVEGPLFQSLLFIAAFSFFAKFWTDGGQTAGMKAWKIRVETLDGRPITLQQALIRFLFAFVSALPLGLGYLWMFVDSNQLTLHERISNTRTTVIPKPQK